MEKEFRTEYYPKGWKLLELTINPKGLRQWINVIYGLDVFVNKVPLLKVVLLANIIYWVLN
jgi:hypothetical protein